MFGDNIADTYYQDDPPEDDDTNYSPIEDHTDYGDLDHD